MQARNIWEEGNLVEKIPPSVWPMGKPVGHDWYGRAYIPVGGTTTGLVGHDAVRFHFSGDGGFLIIDDSSGPIDQNYILV